MGNVLYLDFDDGYMDVLIYQNSALNMGTFYCM